MLIRHRVNQGVGGAIVTGYKKAIQLGMDIAVVMAGDNQMDPADLPALLDPVVDGKADYAKGNRLLHKDIKTMPQYRYFGNSILTILNKIASGYWHVMDPQCGYTAVDCRFLSRVPLDSIYKRYGVPNDLLVIFNVYGARVLDVPVKPVYGEEKSKIKLRSYVPKVSMLLLRRFFWRLKEKYLLRDFHPLVFFYFLGLLLLPIGFIYGIYILAHFLFVSKTLSTNAVLLCAFLIITGLQTLFFAMSFDQEYNRPR